MKPNPKFIFMSGGVTSSLGKGLTSASIAMLLESRGIKVSMLKLDPYLNVDPGTMSPFQHGEVYVTDDGAETDLDLGHYFRFTHAALSKASNATAGQIYDRVIKKERRGDFLGKTVQVIPHVTDEIKQSILQASQAEPEVEVVLVEIGGTVGDIESLPFFEAIRQFRYERPKDCLNIHLTYVPYLKAAGEVKTKPTQHSVQILRGIGIIPDIILCRCEESLSEEIKDKISLFCSVRKESVFDEPDVPKSIYEVPIFLHKQGVDRTICELLGIEGHAPPDLTKWNSMLEKLYHPKQKVVIGIVGKYLQHQDAYKSVFEALFHAATDHQVELEIRTFDAEKSSDLENQKALESCDGYLVPGGFGSRGLIGKILIAKYCRENKVPYFGLCLGMQILCIEFARHVLGLTEANSTEMDPNTIHPVISLLSEQKHVSDLGGTMRLGAYPCLIKEGSKAAKAYKKTTISERHRHRWEFNNLYKEEMEKNGLVFSGYLEKGHLCEITEIKDHPWMLGVQFHPEFKSKPTEPHPLFRDFIAAALAQKQHKENHCG